MEEQAERGATRLPRDSCHFRCSHFIVCSQHGGKTKRSRPRTEKNPQAAAVVEKSFYVNDGLTGADSIEEAVELQKQVQDLFSSGGFLLPNSNQPAVLQHPNSETPTQPKLSLLTSTQKSSGTRPLIIFISPSRIYLLLTSSLSVFSSQTWPRPLMYLGGFLQPSSR